MALRWFNCIGFAMLFEGQNPTVSASSDSDPICEQRIMLAAAGSNVEATNERR